MRDCKTCQFYDVSGVKIQLKGSEKSIVVVVKMQEETQPGPNKLHRLSLVSPPTPRFWQPSLVSFVVAVLIIFIILPPFVPRLDAVQLCRETPSTTSISPS
jgi:hypothetical protein